MRVVVQRVVKAAVSVHGNIHGEIGFGLLVLAGIHVLAGLKHHYIDRDDVLRRMMPGSG